MRPKRLERLREHLLALLPPSPRVLDLGSGPGHDGALLASHGASVVALDPAEGLLLEAARYNALSGRGICGDARRLPFTDAAFDGVWSCASLLHVPHAECAGAIAEVHRVLRPGGVALFSISEGEEAAMVPVTGLGLHTRAYYYHDADAWADLLRSCGFEVVSHNVNRESGNFNPGSTGWLETVVRKP